jgi:glycosyltransferase involved in cell wall biosynthesis
MLAKRAGRICGALEKRGRGERPKVLHILEATSAGAARYVTDLLLNIDTRQFNVSFVYSLIRSDGRFRTNLERIRGRGIAAVEVPMARNISPLTDARAFLSLYRLLRGCRFDIVHCHSSKAGFLGRIAAKLAHPGTVTLYSPHAIAISVNPFYWILEKFAAQFTDAVLGVSQPECEQLADYWLIRPSKLRCVTAAIDVDSYAVTPESLEFRRRLGVRPGVALIGTAGRLAPQKDPWSFLKVIDIVRRTGLPSFFVWVGDGELRDQIVNEAKALQVENSVVFTGYRSDLPCILGSLDIFILTSAYESFSYVTCEAMALGKPVVATDVPGPRELVEAGKSGFLVGVKEPRALAAKLLTLIEDPALRRCMGAAGRRRAEQHFNLPRMIREVEELYLSVLVRQKP